jgi:ATP-dependent Clp protease ATP-binding subunit ClpB
VRKYFIRIFLISLVVIQILGLKSASATTDSFDGRLRSHPALCGKVLAESVQLDTNVAGGERKAFVDNVSKKIIGQNDGVDAIALAVVADRYGLSDPKRPVGSFIFLGPTGTGKTSTVEASAEEALGKSAIIKIDCAEFQLEHEVTKLIGSPPGYLGHRETQPRLNQAMLNAQHTEKAKLSFVLFDEVEKAHDSLWRLILGVLDRATLSLGDNSKVDFSRTLVFMTSNLGQKEMQEVLHRKVYGLAVESVNSDVQLSGKALDAAALNALYEKFTLEFLNRIDKTVVFQPLTTDALAKILDNELGYLQDRIFTANRKPLTFVLTPEAKQYILHVSDTRRFNGREIRKKVEQHVQKNIINLLDAGVIDSGDVVEISYDQSSEKLNFVKINNETLPDNILRSVADSFYPALKELAEKRKIEKAYAEAEKLKLIEENLALKKAKIYKAETPNLIFGMPPVKPYTNITVFADGAGKPVKQMYKTLDDTSVTLILNKNIWRLLREPIPPDPNGTVKIEYQNGKVVRKSYLDELGNLVRIANYFGSWGTLEKLPNHN